MNINSKNIGLISGPLAFLAVLFFFNPESLNPRANAILASTIWIAIWWITEAIPIAVTALLPIILFPLTGGLGLTETTASFGHKYVFLYIGGFIIAIAIEKWNLHKRIALNIINLIGTNIVNIILGFMIATAFMSMWISNTATAVMMLPIAMAIVSQLRDNPDTIEDENKIFGKLGLWPGDTEEILGAKAWYVRDGYFDNVDMCIFTHVSTNMSTSWGRPSGTGLISVKYTFSGETAHSAGSPWRARSALDAAELMNVGWNYRREHLHPDQRSHSIFLDAGDQPNVVPSKASIWYFLREITYKGIMEMYDAANKMAQGAALMTNTTYESEVLGAAWPRHFNKIIAEEMYENIKKVGLPKWSEDDQRLARAVQKEIGIESINGLPTKLPPLRKPLPYNVSGGSDDIGDVSWKVPTVVLRFPSNIPDVTFHHWSASIAAATPIAHKGANAGAKVVAMTAIDFLTKPEKLAEAKSYFDNVQSKEDFYRPMISETDPPPVYLNTEKMEKYRDQMEKFYFDETKYDTYLEQLGVDYPEIKKED